MDDSVPILESRKVTKVFGNTMALEDVTFSVGEGEFVCLLGPSGCGKTTLLYILGGFLKPTYGQVFYRGGIIKEPSPERGLIFQDDTLFPWLSVEDNISFALKGKHKERDMAGIVEKYLEMMGLADFRGAHPHQLSGGMRRRAEVARTLANGSEVMLMDEPLRSLDAQTRNLLQDEVQRIWQRTGRTVFFVTHDIEEAIALSSRIIILSARPGTVKNEVEIDLPRPRDRLSDDFFGYKKRVTEMLGSGILGKRTVVGR